jgi:hypothetical protein
MHAEHLLRASRTYGSAADHYTRPSLAFWNRYGAETVARLGLRPGDTVLDLCSGAGARRSPRRSPSARTDGCSASTWPARCSTWHVSERRARAWGPHVFEPGNSVFWDTVRGIEPALHKAFNPWDAAPRRPRSRSSSRAAALMTLAP